MASERKHGFPAEPVQVSAYVGSSKNLKDLKTVGDSLIRRRTHLEPYSRPICKPMGAQKSYILSGPVVEFDPKEVLGRSKGPTAGRRSRIAS